MEKNTESMKRALEAGATPKDIEKIARRADRLMRELRKQIASNIRSTITEWENNKKMDYPLEEFRDLHSEFCAQSLDIAFKSYDECEELSKKKR